MAFDIELRSTSGFNINLGTEYSRDASLTLSASLVASSSRYRHVSAVLAAGLVTTQSGFPAAWAVAALSMALNLRCGWGAPSARAKAAIKPRMTVVTERSARAPVDLLTPALKLKLY